jgi:hypothetical protein
MSVSVHFDSVLPLRLQAKKGTKKDVELEISVTATIHPRTSATVESPAEPPEVEIFSIELVESWDIEELCEDGFLDELRDAAVEKAAEIAEAAHP